MRRHFLVLLAVCIGCGSIPDVVFVDDISEGGTDGGSPIDGGTEASSFDGVAPSFYSCSNLPPNSICCPGNPKIVCVGDCQNGSQCRTDCSNKCDWQTQLCCRNQNGETSCISNSVTTPEVCPQ